MAGAFAVTDWIAVARKDKRLECLAKPVTLLALIGVALLLQPIDGTLRRSLFPGPALVVVTVGVLVGGHLLRVLLDGPQRLLFAPVAVYVVVISGMVALALATGSPSRSS